MLFHLSLKDNTAANENKKIYDRALMQEDGLWRKFVCCETGWGLYVPLAILVNSLIAFKIV
jgi:hypothetical protein